MRKITARTATLVLPIALAAGAAMGQTWPPGMAVQPQEPDPTSQITVTLSGDWRDSCPPNTADVVITGTDINLNIRREPPPGFCLMVITPYQLPIEVGALPAGTYSVYTTYYHHGSPQLGPDRIGTIEVTAGCYADCNSDGELNVSDFLCFIDEFAVAQGLPPAQQIEHYANCDGATTEPILSISDFLCFIDEFAQGCP